MQRELESEANDSPGGGHPPPNVPLPIEEHSSTPSKTVSTHSVVPTFVAPDDSSPLGNNYVQHTPMIVMKEPSHAPFRDSANPTPSASTADITTGDLHNTNSTVTASTIASPKPLQSTLTRRVQDAHLKNTPSASDAAPRTPDNVDEVGNDDKKSEKRGFVFKGNNLRKIAVDNEFEDSDEDGGGLFSFFRRSKKSGETGEGFGAKALRHVRRALYVGNVFFKLSLNDASQRKGSFCLGLFSVIIVVFIAAIMFTTLGNLQMIFLKLGEADSGQMDVLLEPGGQVQYANSLDYNNIIRLFPDGSSLSYHSPRAVVTSNYVRFASPWGASSTLGYCDNTDITSLPTRDTNTVAARVWRNSSASWAGENEELAGCLTVDCALLTLCPEIPSLVPGTVNFINEGRENRMKLGTEWTARFPDISDPDRFEEAAIIDSQLSRSLGVQRGDRFLMFIDASYPLMQTYQVAGLDDGNSIFESVSPEDKPIYTSSAVSIISLQVADIVDETYGKLPSDDEFFVMLPYSSVNELIGRGLSPFKSTADQRNIFKSVDPNLVASQIIFNFPPDERIGRYVDDNYDAAQEFSYDFAGKIVAPIGFNQVDATLPLLRFLFSYRFFSMFLSLLIWIIIVALSFLSIVLIYSLLTINIESRTYELGVMRMEGFARETLTWLVIVGALLFAIPGWVLGLVLGQAAFLVIRTYLQTLLGAELSSMLSADAVGFATLAGLGIPLVASLAPVTSVLTQQLPDALNTERGRTKAIDYMIERSDDSYFSWTILGMGTALAVFGFLIYYLFPLALINLNLSLLFFIFFAVLLGMLGGLILLSVNFERFVETIIQYVFLFWENDAVFLLIERNLTAHRPRNRKSTLMFALSLGFVIFISVAFQIQMISVSYASQSSFGNEVSVTNSETPYAEAVVIDRVINLYKDAGLVTRYTYDTAHLALQDAVRNASIATVGRFASTVPFIRGIAPNFFENTDDDFLIINKQDASSGLSIGERLYTAEGSSQMVLPTSYVSMMALDSLSDPFELYVVERDRQTQEDREHRHAMSTCAFLDASPVLTFSKFPDPANVDAVMSIPALIGHSYGGIRGVRSLKFMSFSVGTVDEAAAGVVTTALEAAIARIGGVADVRNYYSQTSDLDTATQILNFFFIFTQVMATAICFFALLSSMSTNVLHQAKEIGVLRCLGLKTFPTYRIYIWESFVLVFSASIMGLVVGTVVAYTMLLQNALFTQLPLPFTFPYTQLIIIVVTSILCAFFASFGPVKALLSMPSITHILRRTL